MLKSRSSEKLRKKAAQGQPFEKLRNSVITKASAAHTGLDLPSTRAYWLLEKAMTNLSVKNFPICHVCRGTFKETFDISQFISDYAGSKSDCALLQDGKSRVLT